MTKVRRKHLRLEPSPANSPPVRSAFKREIPQSATPNPRSAPFTHDDEVGKSEPLVARESG